MYSAGILSFTPLFTDSIMAHLNIGRWIARKTGAVCLDTPEAFKMMGGQEYEHLFLINGASLYSDTRDLVHAMMNKHLASGRPVILCVNDYSLDPSGPVKRVMYEPNFFCLGTIAAYFKKPCGYLNWNSLTVFPKSFPRSNPNRPYDVGYYGAYREGRIESFGRFMDSDFVINVLCTPRTVPFYQKHRGAAPVLGWQNLGRFLLNTKFTLYLEDDKQHKEYHSLANRFYECVSAGSVLLFDARCARTLAKAGFSKVDVEPYLVDSPRQLRERAARLSKNLTLHRARQTAWLARPGMVIQKIDLENAVKDLLSLKIKS